MVTKKQELSREDILRSFDSLPDDASVEDFIEHLARMIGLDQSKDQIQKIEDSSGRMDKSRLLESLGRLPTDANVDDFAYRLYVIAKVERGRAASRAGNKVTQEEARERLKRWLQ